MKSNKLFIGEALAAGIALKKTGIKLPFDQRDIFPDHHRRHLEPRRGAGKAAALHDRNKIGRAHV